MLDIGWQELFFIAVIALIVVGPKDLPKVMRTVSQFVRKARGLAREFQGGVADMVREAELDEIKRKVDGSSRSIEKTIKDTVDPTGSLTADFDPAEFNRQLKERVEGGPPKRPGETGAASDGGTPAETPPATKSPPKPQPKAATKPKSKSPAKPKVATKPKSKPKTPRTAGQTSG
jgi:sec-independent protein translocase protein TatB